LAFSLMGLAGSFKRYTELNVGAKREEVAAGNF
jgi:hypothetical protein